VIVYDNFDLSISVSEQSDMKKNELLLACLSLHSHCHPVYGIKQSGFHPEMELEVDRRRIRLLLQCGGTTKTPQGSAYYCAYLRGDSCFPDVFARYTCDQNDKNPHYYNPTRWPEVQVTAN
jgi:hypothetical protein